MVDDDDLILEVAQMSLEVVGGWEVTTANGARDGLVRARAEHPDAIVLDVMMPGMDGPTAAQALKADPETADIPIVLLTAKVQSADRDRFADLPVAGVLAKPFDPMRLPAELGSLLGWT
ncbi:response regulator [Terrabacter carboxydivorans]|uniref:Response regulator n=1 Tax=Terrabacter carboxydivorans TaxID=619730 RepID=A0ABP5ZRS4_9MICO